MQTNKLLLRFTSLTEDFSVTTVVRTPEVLLYRDSTDTRVSSEGITVRTRRKWRAQEAVEQAEVRLRHGMLVGFVAAR